eukprot:1922206-Amphidinium_carterae.1
MQRSANTSFGVYSANPSRSYTVGVTRPRQLVLANTALSSLIWRPRPSVVFHSHDYVTTDWDALKARRPCGGFAR